MFSICADRDRSRVGASIAAMALAPCLVLSLAPISFGQELLWQHQFGSTADDLTGAVIADGAGGMLVIGSTAGDLAGQSAGNEDVWLARFDGDGHQVWIRQFGSSSWDYGYGLAPDGAGGFFASGQTFGNLGGPNAGDGDVWLARFDASGNRLWTVQYGTANDELGNALAPDGNGGVFVAGWLSLAHYDAAGPRVWLLPYSPDTVPGFTSAVTPDGAGGVYVGGCLGGFPGWIARFDGSGTRLAYNEFSLSIWLRPFPWSMLPDGGGGLFITGWYGATVEAEPGGFVGRFDSNGAMTWSNTYTHQNLYGSALDARGGFFAGGQFFARYDAGGNQVWTAPAPSISGMVSDNHGGVYLAGVAAGAGQDIVIAHFGSCYANCDLSTANPILNVNDFSCFINHFAAGDPYANCDQSSLPPVLNVNDFVCFMTQFAAGCS